LLAVGGFDTAFRFYEAPELHLRIAQRFGGKIRHIPTAIVMHRHRTAWKSLWQQQVNYGRGYGHFLLRYSDRWPWSLQREAHAWARLLLPAARAATARGDAGLVWRGLLLKQVAQRVGFVSTFFSPRERRRFRRTPSAREPGKSAEFKSGNRLPLWLAVGHFILRAPARLARSELPVFLKRVAAQPRDGTDFVRVARLSRRWLRLPLLRSRDTCYLRSFILFRFVDARDGDMCLHFGVDEQRISGERLHGHAWVSLDGRALNPPATLVEGRLREIYRFSKLNGAASKAFAAAMIRRGD
jgi:hypothetical protein